jgi:hypothetical protein
LKERFLVRSRGRGGKSQHGGGGSERETHFDLL